MPKNQTNSQKLVGYNHAIWVLMWKHLKERKRCLCHTIWEITSGVLVFAVFFLVVQTWYTYPNTHDNGPPSEIHNDINISNIFFSPNSSFNQLLMKRVAQKAQLDGYLNSSDSVHGFRSDADMYDFMKLLGPDGTVVINFEGDTVSSNYFKYAIGRVKSKQTNEFYLMLDGYIDMEIVEDEAIPSLAKLQWAVDSAYMEQLSDENITHDIQLQPRIREATNELFIMHSFLLLCTLIAPLPFFLYNSSRLIVESRSGLKELMKMMSVTPNTLRFSHLLDTALVGIIYSALITIFLKVTTKPILPHTNGLIIAISIMLHFLTTTSLAFITCALSQDFNHADSVAMLIYMCTYMWVFIWYTSAGPRGQVAMYFICCLVPHAPVYLFWDSVVTLEMTGEGSNFFNLFRAAKNEDIAVALLWLLSIIHLVIILLLAWYVDLVRPGRYGIPKKWTFLFEHDLYSNKKKKVTFHVTSERVEILRDDRYFEKPLLGLEVAIKIIDVSKVFHKSGKLAVRALDAVNLDIYRGEVTVLLGANGAGKSTLMYIITGMYSATKGKVYINGLNIANRIQELRKDFGLCPQNNVTFEYLTVRENIRFFEMLKSVNEPLQSTADRLLIKLKLMDKADYFSHQLSAGKKRCLQMACALAGACDVLVLDEPTTGMDPESRHSLWDIIMELRGRTTVLMTTSCLEEADALGDRVALLNAGRLRCHGTPGFLKRAIGAGFNLSIMLKHQRNADDVKNLVELTIPRATYKMFENKRIIFNLPSTKQDRFPLLFDLLEEKKKEFGIALIEVGLFMEEIFLGFIDQDKDNDLVIESSLRSIHDHRLEGYCLLLQQLRVLLIRCFIYMWRKKTQFIVLQIVLPIVSITVITVTSNAALGYGTRSETRMRHVVSLAYDTGPYRRSGLFENLWHIYPGLHTMYTKDLSVAHHAPQTVGFEMSENNSTIYYPLNSQDVVSKAVNMFSNVYMAVHMPYAVNRTIDTQYDDVEMRVTEGVIKPKHLLLCMEWAIWMVFLSVLPLAPQILLSINEHRLGIRHTHYTAGCTPIIHWTAKLIAQTAVYLAIIPFTILFIAYVLDFDKTLNQMSFLGCTAVMLIIFGPAFLAHMYVLSFFLDVNNATSVIYIITMVFAAVVPIFLYVISFLKRSYAWLKLPHFIMKVLAYGSPVFTATVGLCRLTTVARMNAYCSLNKHLCPDLFVDDLMFSPEQCCESPSRSPFGYYNSADSGLYDLLLLMVHFCVNFAIVILMEYRVFPNLFACLMNYMYTEPEQSYDEPTVLKEIEYVQKKKEINDYDDDALLVYNLHKHYFISLMKLNEPRYTYPVRGVSFAAKYGECFCILGPNDAGKTATLLMLAGYLSMTKGDVCVGGTCIRQDRSQYLHSVNLISTRTGMDGFLSGQQNLTLFAKMQGHTETTCNRLARQMLAYMGLQSFSNTNVSHYSVGCSRRLALCASLVVSPMVALLEEPLTMVDPYTRPLVVRALKRMLNDAAAVVVTETSLERTQLETIFDRVAIMFRGQFAAVGTVEEVNASLATGYSVRIKLRMVVAYKIASDFVPSSVDTIVTTISSVSGSSKDAGTTKETGNSKEVGSSKEIGSSKDLGSSKDIGRSRNLGRSKDIGRLKDSEKSKGSERLKDIESSKDIGSLKDESEMLQESRPLIRTRSVRIFNNEKKAHPDIKVTEAPAQDETDEDITYIEEKKRQRQTSILYAEDVRDLKKDMEEIFPTSELTNEHLSILYYFIEDFDKTLQYSTLFTHLEGLRERYDDLIEDYTLSVATVEEVYRALEKEQHLKKIIIKENKERIRIASNV